MLDERPQNFSDFINAALSDCSGAILGPNEARFLVSLSDVKPLPGTPLHRVAYGTTLSEMVRFEDEPGDLGEALHEDQIYLKDKLAEAESNRALQYGEELP